MNVQLLLPVHVYRVYYQVGTSQPVTKLEGLVLQAIQEGKSDLGQLAQVFCLHQRVLMEVVVALFGAGKLCLTAEGQLALPPAFDTAGLSGDSLDSQAGLAQQVTTHVEIQDEVQELIEERVLGQLCRSQWVRYRPLYSIARDLRNRLMPAGDLPSELQRGRCIPFLYPSQPDDPKRYFVHGILRTELVRARQDVVLVEVDTDQDTVSGLPKPWRTQLVPRLVAFAKAQVQKEGTPKAVHAIRLDEPVSSDQTSYWEGTPTPQELVFRRGVSPEDTALCRALRDNTTWHLLILTRTLALPAVDRLLPLLESAVKRGVQIDVLWGTSPDPKQVAAEASHREAVERLREFARTVRRARWPGGLSIGEQPSEVATNLLLSTHRPTDSQTVSVGWATKDWLAQGVDGDELEIRHRGLVQAVCAILLDVVMGEGQLAHSATPTLLANTWELLLREQRRTEDRSPVRDTLSVRLWLDGAHEHPSLDPLARLAKQTNAESALLQHDQQLLLTSYRFANPRALPRQRGYAGDLGIEVCGPLQQKEESPP